MVQHRKCNCPSPWRPARRSQSAWIHRGDVNRAIATDEKALKPAPDDPQLTSKLKPWRADADANRGFVESRVDRFRVSFQGHADKALAAWATVLLESAFWRIGKILGAYPSDPVAVMLYTEKQFRDITLAPEWSGGIYDGRIRVPAAGAVQSPQLFERVLVHELTHAIIASLIPRCAPAVEGSWRGGSAALSRRQLQSLHIRPGHGRPTTRALSSWTCRSSAARSIGTRSFRALSDSSRTEYTFDNFGLRYSGLENELGAAIGARAASLSR